MFYLQSRQKSTLSVLLTCAPTSILCTRITYQLKYSVFQHHGHARTYYTCARSAHSQAERQINMESTQTAPQNKHALPPNLTDPHLTSKISRPFSYPRLVHCFPGARARGLGRDAVVSCKCAGVGKQTITVG